MFKKETGENPVQARCREAHTRDFFLLFAAKRGQTIERKFEKVRKVSAAVEIFFEQMPFIPLREPTKKEKTKNILGECKL